MSKVSLLKKVALITGASSGIGRATSVLFSKLGANLALCGRNEEQLNATAEICRSNGGAVLTIAGDLTTPEVISQTIGKTIDRYQRLDCLVNNAGIIATGSIETTHIRDLDHMFNVNVRSVFQLTQLALPYLEQREGSIVNVSSITGIRAFPGVLSYCMSKAAIDQFTQCLALELAAKKVRVNAVNPGVIVTELQKRGGLNSDAYKEFLERSKQTHALGRPGDVDEVAQTIAFLASEASSFITGISLSVDGGRHAMCPR